MTIRDKIICAVCKEGVHDPKFPMCRECMLYRTLDHDALEKLAEVRWIMCGECKKNLHKDKWNMCYGCKKVFGCTRFAL